MEEEKLFPSPRPDPLERRTTPSRGRRPSAVGQNAVRPVISYLIFWDPATQRETVAEKDRKTGELTLPVSSQRRLWVCTQRYTSSVMHGIAQHSTAQHRYDIKSHRIAPIA